ncbi:peptidoglycan-binding protein [Streptomonospora sp. S1-112]|uniref:Peptidoglycan-binding protein n=1 Tax=Streptomonospora mangrovi TaxID=2883123 RepID=A0A9X3NTJ4_9ACTN|nr:peptidoglycan-binding domain-containing protein [Streptomonospora mangrovi]MDA0566600.1 peptidoglycan-binding protein [Streptomonospora mangrovi]
MVSITAHHHPARPAEGATRASGVSSPAAPAPRRLLAALLPAARALFDARGLVPEPDPARVRAMLIEIGELDPAAPPEARRAALAAFQRARGLPADGVADGRTVSALSRAWRRRRELRALGLPDTPAPRPRPPARRG